MTTDGSNRISPLKSWVPITAIISSLLCCAGLGYFGVTPKNGSVEKWEADLKKNLPLGSNWEQAEAWFASHGISTGKIGDQTRTVGLGAVIPNSSLLQGAYINIELYFTDTGVLREHVIYREVFDYL